MYRFFWGTLYIGHLHMGAFSSNQQSIANCSVGLLQWVLFCWLHWNQLLVGAIEIKVAVWESALRGRCQMIFCLKQELDFDSIVQILLLLWEVPDLGLVPVKPDISFIFRNQHIIVQLGTFSGCYCNQLLVGAIVINIYLFRWTVEWPNLNTRQVEIIFRSLAMIFQRRLPWYWYWYWYWYCNAGYLEPLASPKSEIRIDY